MIVQMIAHDATTVAGGPLSGSAAFMVMIRAQTNGLPINNISALGSWRRNMITRKNQPTATAT